MALKQIFVTQLTDVDTTARDIVGDIRCESGKFYKYVKLANYTATVAGVAGDPVAYVKAATDATGAAAKNAVVLDMSDAAAQPELAGFLMGTVAGVHTTPTIYYCWIQLTGLVTVPTAVTTGVLGSGFMMGTTDKTLVVATGVIYPGGYLGSASGANNIVMADCPF